MIGVTLIQPPQTRLLQPRAYIPLGLSYIAAALEEADIDVEILNLADNANPKASDIPPADWYGISCVTATYDAVKRLIPLLDGKVVVGGPHPSVRAWETYGDLRPYAIMTGEAEYAFRDLVLGRREHEPIIDAGLIEDLNKLPFPARHLFPDSDVVDVSGIHGQLEGIPATTVITSRGCPYSCNFCLPRGSLVLTADLRWAPIETLVRGDEVVGVEKRGRTKFVRSKVLHTFYRKSETLEIITENGSVSSTHEHPWLTTHYRWRRADKLKRGQFLRFVSKPLQSPNETIEYVKGYFAGSIIGDGSIGHYPFTQNNRRYIHHSFRLVGDYEMLDRFLDYDKKLNMGTYPQKFNPGKLYKVNRSVESWKKDVVCRIEDLVEDVLKSNNDEIKRGFLAGIYDADGGWTSQIRIHNKNMTLLERVGSYLSELNFSIVREKEAIRVIGGMNSAIRFFSHMQPIVTNKKSLIFSQSVNNSSKITDIKPSNYTDVFNIETTSGNFIADGFVTHNCCKGHPMFNWYRYRSTSNVIAELSSLQERYGIGHVRFVDDEFTLHIGRSVELMRALRQVGLTWVCITRADTLTDDLLRLMKLAGCSEIHIGVETFSDRLLRLMNKRTTAKVLKRGIQMIKEAGIQVKVYLMWNYPGETEADRELTLDGLKETRPCKYTVSRFTPLPGSAIERVTGKGSSDYFYPDEDREFQEYRKRIAEALE